MNTAAASTVRTQSTQGTQTLSYLRPRLGKLPRKRPPRAPRHRRRRHAAQLGRGVDEHELEGLRRGGGLAGGRALPEVVRGREAPRAVAQELAGGVWWCGLVE